jgi:hypothetical protein
VTRSMAAQCAWDCNGCREFPALFWIRELELCLIGQLAAFRLGSGTEYTHMQTMQQMHIQS